MIFQYRCDNCNKIVERDFRIGKAKKTVKCDTCENDCKRHYGKVDFVLKGSWGGWPSKSKKLNREMTKKNKDAERRMWKERGGTEASANPLIAQDQ